MPGPSGGTLAAMLLRQFVIDGLGHLSTLIADESAGLAAVVDPRRDVDVYLEAARVSGPSDHATSSRPTSTTITSRAARELAALTGATHVIGAGADLAYESPARPRRRVVRRRRPPFHGPRDARPHARARRLRGRRHVPGRRAAAPVHRRLAARRRGRPDRPPRRGQRAAVRRRDVPLAPRGDPAARGLRGRLPDPRRGLPLLDRHRLDAVVDDRLRAAPQPDGPARRRGRASPGSCSGTSRPSRATSRGCARRTRPARGCSAAHPPEPRPMAVEDARSALDKDAVLVDLRSPAAHSTAHVPGSVSIPSGSSFGTWLGWVVEPDRPLVLMLDSPADWDDAARQAMRIGYENSARPRPGRLRELDGVGRSDRVRRPPHRRPARVAPRPRRPGGAARRRRPPGHRVRRRARAGRPACRGGPPPGPARGPASRPADRDDLRIRLPGERRRVPAAGRRLQRRQLGRRWAPGLARSRPPGRARGGFRAAVSSPDAGDQRGRRRAPRTPRKASPGDVPYGSRRGRKARVPCGHAESRSQAALATIPRSPGHSRAVADANRWRKQCFDRHAATRDRSSACSPWLSASGSSGPRASRPGRHEHRGGIDRLPRAPSARRRSAARAPSRSTRDAATVPRSRSRSPASTRRAGRARQSSASRQPGRRRGHDRRGAGSGPRDQLGCARSDLIRPVGGPQPDGVRLRAARPRGSRSVRTTSSRRSTTSSASRTAKEPPTAADLGTFEFFDLGDFEIANSPVTIDGVERPALAVRRQAQPLARHDDRLALRRRRRRRRR